jgi:hypothetical protein
MPIGTVESNKQVDLKLVYGRSDRMPNSLESMGVCDYSSNTVAYIRDAKRDLRVTMKGCISGEIRLCVWVVVGGWMKLSASPAKFMCIKYHK